MKADLPLISICIPTYNGEKYLQQALASVTAQTYKNIEVIISDDASTDKTMEICRAFKEDSDFPVHIYPHQPAGIGANWNHCISKAKGDYIKFLFQDDILENECLEKNLFYLQQYNLKVVCSKRSFIDGNNQPVKSGEFFEKFGDLQKNTLDLDLEEFYLLKKEDLKRIKPHQLSYNIFGEPIAFLFSKEIFEKYGLFKTDLKQILDTEMGYRILKHQPIGIIAEKLYKFRLHEAQESSLNQQRKPNLSEDKKLEFLIVKNFYSHLSYRTKKHFFSKYYPLIKVFFNFYGSIKKINTK
ncbi:glycosyltransferase family 2 protein [Chryseobacterium caseinilyticum]|uniref:Glycosyltransferase family 2 protein n=1 Tax=Chryseobacterium caseinilyticum TaxID=2771428 RepID=A0ABR8ZGD5_9FLAO|nr:glycosyltransferase [Chryseobacterium caseinilyticum]MBD8084307.1 glycosyltransferase family 2 protein [Chryseobacterium caseinilyticum]